jgi:hypothetical protein
VTVLKPKRHIHSKQPAGPPGIRDFLEARRRRETQPPVETDLAALIACDRNGRRKNPR